MKKKKTTTTKRSSTSASNALALRFKFERVCLNKAMEHARQMRKSHNRGMGDAGDHPPHGPSSPVAMRTMLDIAIDAFLKWKWCSDVAQALDRGIKFLQDHANELTEQQKEDFRKDLASLLESYGDIC